MIERLGSFWGNIEFKHLIFRFQTENLQQYIQNFLIKEKEENGLN